MDTDSELLRQYAQDGSEAAFAELVRRYVDLVYSVAWRQANGDATLAQDVTQVVFVDLARKARVLGGRDTLAGWLHTSARFAACKAIRGEQRRRIREQEAVTMNETPTTAEINWEQLRPLLDEGVSQLKAADRDAIVLRFFQGKTHEEIGAALGLSENSANKRIERALEKLRAYFTRRGVTTTTAILVTAISANSVQAAPVGLAEKSAKTALAGVVGTGFSLALLSTVLLMNAKFKIALAVVLVVVIATLAIFNWSASGEAAARTTTATSNPAWTLSPPKSAAAIQVEAPKAVSSSSTPATATTAPPATVADPQADLDGVISEMTTQLQTGNLFAVFKKFVSPRFLAMIPPERLPQMQQMINEALEDPASRTEMQFMIDGLLDLKTQTPKINEAGDLATYTVDVTVIHAPPAGVKAADTTKSAPTSIRFTKIDGKWYLATLPVNLYNENGKWHLTAQIGPRGTVEPMEAK